LASLQGADQRRLCSASHSSRRRRSHRGRLEGGSACHAKKMRRKCAEKAANACTADAAPSATAARTSVIGARGHTRAGRKQLNLWTMPVSAIDPPGEPQSGRSEPARF
jgi:hypothetical protein